MSKLIIAVIIFMVVWLFFMAALSSLSAQAIDPLPTMLSTNQVMPTATLQPSPTLQPWPRLYDVYLPSIGGE